MAEATPRRRWALLAAWSVGVVALAALYGPALVRHAGRSLDPLVYNDDVRVLIFPFFHYSDPSFSHTTPSATTISRACPKGTASSTTSRRSSRSPWR